MTKDEQIELLRSSLQLLLDSLGSGITGDDRTEWCVACNIELHSTDEYKTWIDASHNYRMPGIPHKTPCPIVAAREALQQIK